MDLIAILGWQCHCCRATIPARVKSLEGACTTLKATCDSLKNEIDKLRSSNAKMAKELEELKSMNVKLNHNVSTIQIEKSEETKNQQAPGSSSSSLSWSNIEAGKRGITSQSTVQEVVKAVHSDLISKKQRETNIVVSGLKPAEDKTDLKLVETLISANLNIEVKPITCKRIGKLSDDKIQPLLVVLPSASLAENVVSKAKLLRKSESLYTSQHVYINRFLTKSEAEAEFEMRQKRRARELKRKEKINEQGAGTNHKGEENNSNLDMDISAQRGDTKDREQNTGDQSDINN